MFTPFVAVVNFNYMYPVYQGFVQQRGYVKVYNSPRTMRYNLLFINKTCQSILLFKVVDVANSCAAVSTSFITSRITDL